MPVPSWPWAGRLCPSSQTKPDTEQTNPNVLSLLIRKTGASDLGVGICELRPEGDGSCSQL